MRNHYRKPRFHVIGLTSFLLKGYMGNLFDWDDTMHY
jgi:hypothetical protein